MAVLTGVPLSTAAAQSHTAAALTHRSGLFSASHMMTKALFVKVHRAYLHVPAVELSVIPRKSTLRFPRRFVLILRSGVLVARNSGGQAATHSRWRRGVSTTPTPARQARPAGAVCLRRTEDARRRRHSFSLHPREDQGIVAGTDGHRKVATENRAQFRFLALQRQRPAQLLDRHHLPIKRFITYAIDAKSHRLRSLYIQQPQHRPQSSWPTAGPDAWHRTAAASAHSGLLNPRAALEIARSQGQGSGAKSTPGELRRARSG